MLKILIIEDDIPLSQGITLTLKDTGREFSQCYDIASAELALKTAKYDLMILDINLPDGSGLAFCQKIRSSFPAPILFLTANDNELDMVMGLETGGDDYMTKPFSLAVLRAKVNALLRRSQNNDPHKIIIDNFSFDFDNLVFSKNNQPLELSKTEQRLLLLLINNPGKIISRERLLERIWPDGSSYVDENALSVAIRRLRSKIEDDPSKPVYIQTVYGMGYSWVQKK